jgi:hypothetical protein
MSFIGDALSSVSSALSGPAAAASSAAPDSTPQYFKGDAIGQAPAGVGGSYAPNDPGAADTGELIEFIHFGFVHPDYSTNFGHENSIQDDGDAKLPQNPATPGSRAVMYRGALERETLLLGGFVASTQTVLQEREQNEGSIGSDASSMMGAAVAEASSLLGGGSSAPASSGGVKSTDLNDENSKVKTVGGNVNVAAMTYTIAHQAGEDLAQARANYQQVIQKVAKPPADQNAAGGGLMSQLSSTRGSIPGVGPIFNTIQGIATKVFDIYVAVYAQLAIHCELAIEKACHDVTIDAIQNNKSPIFPVWFYKPADATSQDQPLFDTSSGDMGSQASALPGKLKDKAEDTGAQMAHKFLDVPTDDYPAAAQLDAAFATDAPKPAKDQPPAPASQVGDLAAQAFADVLGASIPGGFTLPFFVKTIISEIMETDVDVLQEIYKQLLPWDQSQTIPADEILDAGREALLDRALDLLTSQFSFLTDLQKSLSGSNLLSPPDGKPVTSGEVINKASDFGKSELAQKLAPGLDPILKFAMGDLASQLDSIRSTAQAQKAVSMEAYLGRLPYLEALLFRNTFFPMWDLLVQKVFGSAAGPLSGYLNSAGSFYKSAKDDVWTAQDDVSRAQNVANVAGQGLGVGTGEEDPTKKVADAWNSGGIAPQSQNPAAAQMQQDFPIQGRLNSATGTDITQSEFNGVTVIGASQYTDYPPSSASSAASAT